MKYHLRSIASNRRHWGALGALWIIATVVLGGVTYAAIQLSVPEESSDQLDRYNPSDLGTTWVYALTLGGAPGGTRTVQIVGPTFAYAGEPPQGVAVRSQDWGVDNAPSGPAAFYYVARAGDVLELRGSRSGATPTAADPPRVVFRLPVTVGDTWEWVPEEGSLDNGLGSVTATIVGFEDVDVAGESFSDCIHSTTTFVFEAQDGSGNIDENVNEWSCPDVGVVRIHDAAPDVNYLREEELVAFHTPGRSVGRHEPLLPDPPAVASPVIAPIEAPTLDHLTWSVNRRDQMDFAPTGSGTTLITGEGDGTVTASDTRTGVTHWRVALAPPIVAAPVVAGSAVIAAAADKSLFALDLRTGAARWALELRDIPSTTPVVVGTLVIVPLFDRTLNAYDAATGQLRWSTMTGDVVTTEPVVQANTLYIGERGGGVVALEAATGAEVWSSSLDGALFAGPAVGGDTLAVISTSNVLFGLDTADGSARWQHRLPVQSTTAPAITDDTIGVVVDGDLRGFDAATGAERWVTPVGEAARPPLATAGGFVVVSDEGIVSTIDADGAVTARSTIPAEPGVSGALALGTVDGSVVVGMRSGSPWPQTRLYAFPAAPRESAGVRIAPALIPLPITPFTDPASDGDSLIMSGTDGSVWRILPGENPQLLHSSVRASPYVRRSADVVVVQDDVTVVALPAAGGEPLWQFDTGSNNPFSLIALTDDAFYIILPGIAVVAMDPHTGAERWRFPIESTEAYSAPLPLEDGDVVLSVDGSLLRLSPDGRDVRWRSGALAFGALATDGERVVYANYGLPAISALELDSGDAAWTYENPDIVPFEVTIAGDVALASLNDTTVAALAMADGALLWEFAVATSLLDPPRGDTRNAVIVEAGRHEDILQRDYVATVLDVHTGEFLGSLEMPGTTFSPLGGLSRHGEAYVVNTNQLQEVFLEMEVSAP